MKYRINNLDGVTISSYFYAYGEEIDLEPNQVNLFLSGGAILTSCDNLVSEDQVPELNIDPITGESLI